MGRGVSKGSGGGGGGNVSDSMKQQLTNGIMNHGSAANDRAQKGMEDNIAKERNIVNNYSQYRKSGYISGRNDPWYVGHVNTLNSLTAQLNFFKKERKRLKR